MTESKRSRPDREGEVVLVIGPVPVLSIEEAACAECVTSCQSACKTSCTVGNQACPAAGVGTAWNRAK